MRDTIGMAREACPYTSVELRGAFYDGFMKAAALVRADEREVCANAAMVAAEEAVNLAMALEREACAELADKLEWADNKGIASAIRARGNT